MDLTQEQKKQLIASVRDVKDFPKEGIIFKDITTLVGDPKSFTLVVNHLKARYESYKLDFIVGAESRGFIFGAALAVALGVGFVPVRKPGKLPYTTVSEKYALEYGFGEMQIHIDAFRGKSRPRVLFIDDLIATGGTARASIDLIRKIGGDLVEACFIIELLFLGARKDLAALCPIYSVLEV